MTRIREVIVSIQAGTPRLGLWCDGCLLPSAIEVDALAVLPDDGVYIVGTYRVCVDCGQADHCVRPLG